MNRAGLTRLQADLLAFIANYCAANHGTSPSYDEMMGHLDLSSKSSVHRLLSGLEERGAILRRFNRARSIVVVDQRERFAPHIEAALSQAMQETGVSRERFIEIAVAEFVGVSA